MFFFWFDNFAGNNFSEDVFAEGYWIDVVNRYGAYTIQQGIINRWIYITDNDGIELLTTKLHAQEYVKLYFYAHTMAKQSKRLIDIPALKDDLAACDKVWGYPYSSNGR